MKQILIINIGALGDNLLATPFIRAVHQNYQGSLISLVTSSAAYEALKTNPFIDKFFVIDYKNSSFKEKLNLCGKLKKIKPDIVFNLTEKIWGYLWAYFSGAKERIGFTPCSSQPVKAGIVYFLINRRAKFLNDLKKTPELHEAERYFLLLKRIGIEAEAGALEVYPVGTGRDLSLQNKIIIHLAKKWFQGGWTKEDFVELVKGISAERKESIVISYGIQEKDWAGDVIDNIVGTGRDLSLQIQSYFINDILAFAEELKSAKLLISPDTGIVHLAAAVGTPVINIFEEEFFEHNSIRWHPWKTKYVLIKKNKDKKEEIFAEALQAVKQLLNA